MRGRKLASCPDLTQALQRLDALANIEDGLIEDASCCNVGACANGPLDRDSCNEALEDCWILPGGGAEPNCECLLKDSVKIGFPLLFWWGSALLIGPIVWCVLKKKDATLPEDLKYLTSQMKICYGLTLFFFGGIGGLVFYCCAANSISNRKLQGKGAAVKVAVKA